MKIILFLKPNCLKLNLNISKKLSRNWNMLTYSQTSKQGTKRWERLGGRRREIVRYAIWVAAIIASLAFIDHISAGWGQLDIREDFIYPYDIPEFPKFVDEVRRNATSGRIMSLAPVNVQHSSVPFIRNAIRYPEDYRPYGILIVVKSAIKNLDKRDSIRQTWGSRQYLEDMKLHQNLPSRLVFICGLPKDYVVNDDVDVANDLFPQEWMYNDIIISDFVDAYDNNTYKSISALKWATLEFPSSYDYLLLVDDDMYVDLANLIKTLEEIPTRRYAKQLNSDGGLPFSYLRQSTIYNSKNNDSMSGKLILGKELLKKGLYMGCVYGSAIPMRESHLPFTLRRKSWTVSLEEYPYDYFPPYVPGAAIVFSKNAVSKFYYASFFAKYFWIDDVYFGIIAKKLGILPLQNPHFFAGYPENTLELTFDQISEAIAIHGCQCPAQMVELWNTRDPDNLAKC